jgi:hypothetical protein
VFFLLFGSSAAGKTWALDELRGRVEGLVVHDFDEIGVPPGADTAWRHRADERWVRRALEYQSAGLDLLLAGQTPPGELLATPSALELESISACLLDCDDETRVARLRARGPEWLDRTAGDLDDYVAWAEWMRRHAVDPTRRTDVVRHEATESEMQWSRLEDLQDWCVHTVDTSTMPVPQVAKELLAWIAAERTRVRAS